MPMMYVEVVISVCARHNRHAYGKYLVVAKLSRTNCNGGSRMIAA
jgi:hypothetical protein